MSRSASGVAANYRAACRSAFWLEIVHEAGLATLPKVLGPLNEANELTAISAASRITAQRRANLK